LKLEVLPPRAGLFPVPVIRPIIPNVRRIEMNPNQLSYVFRHFSSIENWKINFVFWLSILGASFIPFSIFFNFSNLGKDISQFPESLLVISIGASCFFVFFPLSLICYLSKHITNLEDRISSIENTNKSV
jgi:hypothetical protein